MTKSKTQAEKRRERESRQQEKDAERQAEREARQLEFQQQRQQQSSAPKESKILSKKELRKQKKTLQKESDLNPKENAELKENLTIDKNLALKENLELNASPQNFLSNVENTELEENLTIRKNSDLKKDLELKEPPKSFLLKMENVEVKEILGSKEFLKNFPLAEETFITNSFKDITVSLQKSKTLAKEKAIQDVKEETSQSSVSTEGPARIVQNHSTSCKGLKPVLIRLQKSLPGCTILPGEISQGKNHCEEFELRFQRIIDDTTYKFVARNGYSKQDVSIIVPNTKDFSKNLICECIEDAIKKKSQQVDNQAIDEDICLSNYNQSVAYERQNLWRAQHQEQHQQIKGQENDAKREQKIKKQSRKLAAKGLSTEVIKEYAERDVDIISGKSRGKYSMS